VKPRYVLDLFCGAGGAAMGLHRAWPDAEIVGVDIKPMPRYPFKFVQADAMTFPLEGYDFIWASPPCQGYSRLRHLPWLKGRKYPMLIDAARTRLQASGVDWCLENVEDAPVIGFILCGQMFGLPVYRHRRFETSQYFMTPSHNGHQHIIGHGRRVNDRRKGALNAACSKGAWTTRQPIVTVAGGQFKKPDGERALGIDWMSKAELCESIPPAYSEFIARQFA